MEAVLHIAYPAILIETYPQWCRTYILKPEIKIFFQVFCFRWVFCFWGDIGLKCKILQVDPFV